MPDAHIRAVFDPQAVFGDDSMAKFLSLFGIPTFYAHLSYRYWKEDHDAEELAAAGIETVQEMAFRKPKRSQ